MSYPPEDNQAHFQPSEGHDMGLQRESGIRLCFRKGSRRLGGPPRAWQDLQEQLQRKDAELGCRRASLRRWGPTPDRHPAEFAPSSHTVPLKMLGTQRKLHILYSTACTRNVSICVDAQFIQVVSKP